MNKREILGQHMIVGLDGVTLTAEEKRFLVKEDIGGVILFSRNVESPQQIFELCQEVQNLRAQTSSKSPFFISIDMEGGRVARLKEPFTLWPPLRKIGELNSPHASYNFTMALGSELKSMGINLDYAPCLDVFTNPKNTVIGDRAISDDPNVVAKHAAALTRGFLKAGVIPCGKHFPGHGHTIIDSHDDLPVEEADLKRLNQVELIPFKEAFKAGLDLIMTAHILFPEVDKEWPVTLSETFLKTILRKELNYQGLVMTDDLDMKALAKNYDRAMLPVRSLQAGADILLYCNEPASPPMALDSLEKAVRDGALKMSDLQNSLKRIHSFKSLHLKDITPTAGIKNPWRSPESHRQMSQAFRDGRMPDNLLAES